MTERSDAPTGRPVPDPDASVAAAGDDAEVLLAFAPVHKRAFGVAMGAAVALAVFLATVASLIIDPEGRFSLELLGQYFAGYTVSLPGAVIGAAWGFFVGFIAGWFTAFARNLAVATWIFIARTRAELAATRDFLDHI
jgi:hypothetical protein